MLRLKSYLLRQVVPGHEPSLRYLRALTYARYATAYGWTPQQVDDTPKALLDLLIPISNLIREVRDGSG